MSVALNRFERSGTIKIRDGIISDLYTGLPHIVFYLIESWLGISRVGEGKSL